MCVYISPQEHFCWCSASCGMKQPVPRRWTVGGGLLRVLEEQATFHGCVHAFINNSLTQIASGSPSRTQHDNGCRRYLRMPRETLEVSLHVLLWYVMYPQATAKACTHCCPPRAVQVLWRLAFTIMLDEDFCFPCAGLLC